MDDEIARAQRARKGSPFLNTEQAAFYLGLSARKLQQMRAAGTGPCFRRHSRYVRYHIDDLDAWSRREHGEEVSCECRPRPTSRPRRRRSAGDLFAPAP